MHEAPPKSIPASDAPRVNVFLLDLGLPNARAWLVDQLGAGTLEWALKLGRGFYGVMVGTDTIVQTALPSEAACLEFYSRAFTVFGADCHLQVKRTSIVSDAFDAELTSREGIARKVTDKARYLELGGNA